MDPPDLSKVLSHPLLVDVCVFGLFELSHSAMETPSSGGCCHPDVRRFETLRCCLSCGHALALPTSDFEATFNIEHSSGLNYTYKPLNYELGQEIRLLVLKPGAYPEELECEIVHANLLDDPTYEAISYTWADKNGDDTPSCRIICAGGQCPIQITPNCAAALRRVRHRTTARTIWIDSVCIDQSNTGERNHQVRQMGSIYASAVQVLVYLGEHSEASRAVFEYLTKAIVIRNGKSVDVAFPSENYPPPRLVKKFFSRRWFHRVWVIQEVGLARKATVLCGPESLDWCLFSIDRLREGGISARSLQAIRPGVLLLETNLYKQKRSIVNLLHAGRNAQSKDPRDKVFALLSLENDGNDLHISPDYSKPVEWVFTLVAVQLIRNGECLDVLSHVRGQRSFGQLPSWVPDWTVRTNEEPLRCQFSASEKVFIAEYDLKLPTPERLDQNQNQKTDSTPESPNLSVGYPDRRVAPNPAHNSEELHYCSSINSFNLRRQEDLPAAHLVDLPNTIFVRAHRLATITSVLEKRRLMPAPPSLEKHRHAALVSFFANLTSFLTTLTSFITTRTTFFTTYTYFLATFTSFLAIFTSFFTTRTSSLKEDRQPAIPASTPAILSRAHTLCTKELDFWSQILDASEPDTSELFTDVGWQVFVPPTIPASFGSRAECPSCPPSTTQCNMMRGHAYQFQDCWEYRLTCNDEDAARPDYHFCTAQVDEFVAQQRRFGAGRALFSTDAALGLGPKFVKPQDEVWLLDSASVAMVLRRVEKHYVVVGECYLYGALREYHPCPRCGKAVQTADVIVTETIEIR
jgi:hypothetical protein